MQISMLRPDTGIIQSCGNGIYGSDLSILILTEIGFHAMGKLPAAVVACVGGGSNAMGAFYNFIEDKDVELIGCEAAGKGVDTALTAATIATQYIMGVRYAVGPLSHSLIDGILQGHGTGSHGMYLGSEEFHTIKMNMPVAPLCCTMRRR